MRERLDCEFEIVTPMFMAGTDQKSCELRAQSIKGLLHFWWRAFKLGEVKGDLKALKEAEGKVFGHVGDQARKSSFSLSISIANAKPPDLGKMPNHQVIVTSKSMGKTFPINILEYLCYGTHEYHKGAGLEFIRGRFAPAQRFSMTLRFDRHESAEEVTKALYLLIEVGGCGSRSRNGFGSLRLMNPESVAGILGNDFRSDIFASRAFWGGLTAYKQLPAFTAFSSGTLVFRTTKKDYPTWDDCLADIGKTYRERRGQLDPHFIYDKRQYIGAPIIVDKKLKSFLERHAKPYFMKVAKTDGGKYQGRLLYLPSHYCANGVPSTVKATPQRLNEQFQLVCNEFNQLLSKDARLEVVK